MTLEKNENTSSSAAVQETHYSKQDIVDIFEGVGTVEIPLRSEVLARKPKKRQVKDNSPRPKFIIAKPKRKPSKSYLTNLNPRINKADKLWHNLWGKERGELLRYCGMQNEDIITETINDSKVPDCVVDTFIAGRM